MSIFFKTFRPVLTASLLFAGGTALAQDFAPIVAPPNLPPPPAWVGSPPDASSYTETAPSSEVVLGKARLRLGEAQSFEQAAQSSYAEMKRVQQGADRDDRAALSAEANFLASYVANLSEAIGIYSSVIDSVDGIDNEGEGDDPILETLGEADQLITQIDVDTSLVDAACFLDAEECVPPNADHAALVQEINAFLTVLDNDGESAGNGVSSGQILTTARLLKTRAGLAIALAQRAADDVNLRLYTPRGEDGRIKKLINPLNNGKTTSVARSGTYKPATPYR